MKSRIKEVIGPDNIEFIIHSKNYLSAEILVMAFGLATVPIFTRLMVPSEYGILSIFISFSSVFSVLLELNVKAGILRYNHEETKDYMQRYT